MAGFTSDGHQLRTKETKKGAHRLIKPSYVSMNHSMNYIPITLILCISIVNSRIVNITYGSMAGMNIRSVGGKPCHIFKAIPFAKPPVGPLRFRLPEPPEDWDGVRDATIYSAACMSNSTETRSPQKIVSEDCLYMNIFVSEKCLQTSSCPVAFYVHGGALNYQSAVMFDDQYITDRYSSKDIVFVISAFRVGFFGVFAFEHESIAPRNLALYDIIAGLEFTHSQVSAFGGDPRRVTLMGHSQGATTALVFAVSSVIDPHRRLFQQVLTLSPVTDYLVTAERLDLTWRFAYELRCTHTRRRPQHITPAEQFEVLQCLCGIDAMSLLAKQRRLEEQEGLVFDGMLYGPPFVSEGEPYEEFVSGCIARPMLISSTREEYNFVSDETSYDIGSFLQLSHPQQVRSKYFYDKGRGGPKDNYLSQVIFTSNALFSWAFTKRRAKVYLMEFDHGSLAGHAAELPFFLGLHMRKFTLDEQIIDHFYAQSFKNFIHGRAPTSDWLPFHLSTWNFYSVEVNLDKRIYPQNKHNYHSEVVKYWLQNMTLFDKRLQTVLPLVSRMVTPESEVGSPVSILMLSLTLTFALFIVMGVYFALFRDGPGHERLPLIFSEKSMRAEL